MFEFQANYEALARDIIKKAREDLESDLKHLLGAKTMQDKGKWSDDVKRSEIRIKGEGVGFYLDYFGVNPTTVIDAAYKNVAGWERDRKEKRHENEAKRVRKRLPPD